MSPQQLNGDRGTHFDDIYSLGATVYELLTSKPPFYSGNIDRQISERVAPSMTERRKKFNIEPSSVPQTWEKVVAACLAKDPSRRPQSVVEVAQRLELLAPSTRITTALGKISNKKTLIIGGLAALAVLSLAGLYFGAPKRQAKQMSQAAAIPEKSIAVLPFENRSEDKANSYFADGVQDEILTRLSKIADLKVISRTSTQHYKSAPENLPEIARQLGVAHILEGSVQKSGGAVRVNVQLIKADTDSHLWADTFDRKLTDIFLVESEVAKAIADHLQAKLLPREERAIEQIPTTEIVAFDFYTRAKKLILTASGSSNGKTDLLEAVDLLNQAIARDPSFLQAYCQLASAHNYLYFLGLERTSARLELANAAIQAAFGLHPDAGEAHLARAENLYRGYLDYEGALNELKVAGESLPNDARLFELKGYILRRQGSWEEATRNLERAVELDPLNADTLEQMAWQYMFLRRYREVKTLLERVLAIEPNRAVAKVFLASVDYHWKADVRPFHQMIDSIRSTDPSAVSSVVEGWLTCALAERDPNAISSAMSASGESAFGDDTVQFTRNFFKGVMARMLNDEDKARAAFTAARAEQEKPIGTGPGDAGALCVLGLIDAALGQKEEALRESGRAVELVPVEKDAIVGTRTLLYSAMIAAWAGDKNLACEQLANALRHPVLTSYGDLKLLPFWDPLRGDPRFEQIVASLAPKQASK
jgi:TolB-like protein/Flp pilus assembly protein TadD